MLCQAGQKHVTTVLGCFWHRLLLWHCAFWFPFLPFWSPDRKVCDKAGSRRDAICSNITGSLGFPWIYCVYLLYLVYFHRVYSCNLLHVFVFYCPKKIVFWKEMPHTVHQLSFQNLVEVGPRSAQGRPKVGPRSAQRFACNTWISCFRDLLESNPQKLFVSIYTILHPFCIPSSALLIHSPVGQGHLKKNINLASWHTKPKPP